MQMQDTKLTIFIKQPLSKTSYFENKNNCQITETENFMYFFGTTKKFPKISFPFQYTLILDLLYASIVFKFKSTASYEPPLFLLLLFVNGLCAFITDADMGQLLRTGDTLTKAEVAAIKLRKKKLIF